MNEYLNLLFESILKNSLDTDSIKKISIQIEIYMKKYKEVQKFANISSIKEDRDIIIRHFLDALIPFYKILNEWKLIPNKYLYERRWIDLGTGIGIPGIILKIFYPQLNIALAEVKKKRILFLKDVLEDLKLKQVSIIDSSQKKITKNYHYLMVRAYGSLYKIWQESQKYLNKRGKIIAYKGKKEKIDFEINELLKHHPYLKVKVFNIEIPLLNEERNIVYIKSK